MNRFVNNWVKPLSLLACTVLIANCSSGGSPPPIDDLTPDSFTFTASTEGDTAAVTFGQPYEASTTIVGIDKPVAISVVGGMYKIGEGGTYTDVASTVSAGDVVFVQITASSAALTASTATLTVGGESSAFTVTTKADDVPPEVTINPVPATSEITGDTINLSGVALDAQSSVASVVATINGANAISATFGEGGSWFIELPVGIGSNSVVVTVTDANGIQTISDVITATKADDLAPLLALTSHEDNAAVTGATITVAGTVSDEHSTVASVTIKINDGTEAPATYNAEAGTWSAPELPIIIGTNTVTVFATDSLQNKTPIQTLTLTKADDIAPTLAITTPTEGLAVTGATFTVTGTASDANSGLASVSVSNNAGAAVVATMAEGGTWSAAVPLVIGANAITVTAIDNLGLQTQLTVNTTKADDIPPALNITAPIEAQAVTGDSVTVTGTASDANSGLAAVSVSNNEGAAVAATIVEGGAWSATVAIAIGTNAITVTASDKQGLQTQQVVNTDKTDDVKPAVAITSHTDAQVVSGTTAEVSGTVSDEHSGLSGLTVTIKLRDLEVQRTDTDGTWLDNLPLVIGENLITVTAIDAAGNVSEPALVTIVKPDDQQPTIAITSHVDSGAVTGDTIVVSGTSADEHSSLASIALTANGSAVAADSVTLNEDGSWSVASVPVQIGSNPITVTVTDSAGNVSEIAGVTLSKLDDEEPTVDIKFPPPVSMTEDAIVYARGEAQDNNSGIDSVSVTVNDVAATSNGGGALALSLTKGAELIDTATWNITGLDLVDGLNTVRVTVIDGEGNPATSEFKITKAEITSAFPEGNDLFETPYSAVVDDSQGYARVLVADSSKASIVEINLTNGATTNFSDNISQPDDPFKRPNLVALGRGVLYAVDGSGDAVFQIDLVTKMRSVFIDLEGGVYSPRHLVKSLEGDVVYLAETDAVHQIDRSTNEISPFSWHLKSLPNTDVPLSGVTTLYLDTPGNRLLATTDSGLVFGVSLVDGAREILFDQSLDVKRLDWLVPTEEGNTFLSPDSSAKRIVLLDLDTGLFDVKSGSSKPAGNSNLFVLPTGVSTLSQLGVLVVTDLRMSGVVAMDKETGWRVIISKSVHTPE